VIDELEPQPSKKRTVIVAKVDIIIDNCCAVRFELLIAPFKELVTEAPMFRHDIKNVVRSEDVLLKM
jgi:hypothetical protein